MAGPTHSEEPSGHGSSDHRPEDRRHPSSPGVQADHQEEGAAPPGGASTLRFSPLLDPPTRPPTLRPPRAWLSREDADGADPVYFRPGGLSLGRSETCTVTLEDSSLGWQDAEIIWKGEEFHIRSLGRAQTYLVNGQALGDTVLRHGDLLDFGDLTLRWYCP